MSFPPTAEQAAIVSAFKTGKNLVIQAGAGTGKTTTLGLIAEAAQAVSQRGTYIAFNKAIATEAGSKMPSNVRSSTAHSLAFQAVGKPFSKRIFGGQRQFPSVVAKWLGIFPLSLKVYGEQNRTLSQITLARQVLAGVAGFCRSADMALTVEHFPVMEGLDAPGPRGPRKGPVHAHLSKVLLPYAERVWADLQTNDAAGGGFVKMSHDHYLKMFQLSNPKIDGDFLLFDEAQDANPVIAAIVEAQQHLQVILVGDSAQAIYGFTGAVDAMSKFAAKGARTLTLAQSFRFGPAIADVANTFLDALDAPLRLVGFDKVPSLQATLDLVGGPAADAILCRTNAGCLSALIDAQTRGVKAALVGGTLDSVKFIEAARDVKQGRGTQHADLAAFTSWDLVVRYVAEEESTGDLATMVNLIEKHGIETLLRVMGNAVKEADADVVISTAHKSKGREWDAVRITDFALDADKGISPADLMLAYVAVTRAKVRLDVGTLGTWLADQDGQAVVEIDEAEVEGQIAAIAVETRDAVDAVEVPALLVVTDEIARTVYVAVTDGGKVVGPEFTFEDAAKAYADEHGYRVGSCTITRSPVVVG